MLSVVVNRSIRGQVEAVEDKLSGEPFLKVGQAVFGWQPDGHRPACGSSARALPSDSTKRSSVSPRRTFKIGSRVDPRTTADSRGQHREADG